MAVVTVLRIGAFLQYNSGRISMGKHKMKGKQAEIIVQFVIHVKQIHCDYVRT